MKQRLNHTTLLFFAVLLVSGCQKNSKIKASLPDLRATYDYTDTKPFGGKVAHDILQNAYPYSDIEIIKNDFSENYQWNFDTASLYFNISNYYYVNDRDAESLLDFVYKGNTAFISSAYIDTLLLNKIFCAQQTDFTTMFTGGYVRNTSVKYNANISHYKDSTYYYYYPFSNYFPKMNEGYSRTIGYNDSDSADFFVFFWGKGKLFLHAEPNAFSNYFLLSRDNYRYMEEFMQMLPGEFESIYWDDNQRRYNYHATGTRSGTSSGGSGSGGGSSNHSAGSSFSQVMREPGLAAAFWLLLILLLLYILFNSKRRQRIIPVNKPVNNNSIAFAEAIAGLYLSKKDNKLIAEKMITYFNEHVRSNYFISIGPNDPGFADILSRKAGVPFEVTHQLATAIQMIPAATKVTDSELLVLNGLIEQFFKNKV